MTAATMTRPTKVMAEISTTARWARGAGVNKSSGVAPTNSPQDHEFEHPAVAGGAFIPGGRGGGGRKKLGGGGPSQLQSQSQSSNSPSPILDDPILDT